jgi:hypothetical protein
MRPSIWLPMLIITHATFSSSGQAQQGEGLPYTRGSVWSLTMIRTTSGMGDDYLRSLATTWKRVTEEGKKQGVVLSYKILAANPALPDDWDLLLMVEVKNWAALDGIDEKFDAIQRKIIGGEDAQRQLATKRIEVRRILGSKNAQEIFLK